MKNPGQGLCVRESRSGRCWIGSNDFWRYRFYYLLLWCCRLHRVMSMRNTRCRSGRSIVSYEIILSYYGFSRRNQCLLIGWTEAWRLNAIGWRALWSVVIPCTKIVRQKKISRMCDMGMKLCEKKNVWEKIIPQVKLPVWELSPRAYVIAKNVVNHKELKFVLPFKRYTYQNLFLWTCVSSRECFSLEISIGMVADAATRYCSKVSISYDGVISGSMYITLLLLRESSTPFINTNWEQNSGWGRAFHVWAPLT